MASIIQVEELRGLTGGANANTVSMGSGQQFVGSEGQLVQSVWKPFTGTFDTTSTSYVTYDSIDFTPKLTTSRIVVQWSGHVYKYNSGNGYNAPARLMYGNTQLWFNNYLHYTNGTTAQYMFAGSVTGSFVQTTGNLENVNFQAHAGSSGRTYIYANTGGLLIQEFVE